MGRAEAIYEDLVARGKRQRTEPFELHVAAAITALSIQEAERENVPLAERIGLDSGDQARLCALMFPGGVAVGSNSVTPEPQERALCDILWMHSARASRFETLLARMIARRCQRPNHLWQDLGLANRGELNTLMERHFPRLAHRNSGNMKWKKFFYRMMCSAEQFRMCAAPVCTECDDFDDCFGQEDGEALLARIANGRPPDREAHA